MPLKDKVTRIQQWISISMSIRRALDTETLALFYRQLSTLLTAGIAILQAIHCLRHVHTQSRITSHFSHLEKSLLSGQTLHDSLQQISDFNDHITLSLIDIGERTGQLDLALQKVADNYDKKLAFQRQLNQALLYPAILIGISLIIIIVLIFFIIPKFAILFKDHEETLPMLTRIIFMTANTINTHLSLLIMFILYAILTYLHHKLNGNQHHYLYVKIRKLPLIKHLIKQIETTQLLFQLTMLYQAGISIIDTVAILAMKEQPNWQLSTLSTIHQRLLSGHPLHQAIRHTNTMPSLISEMIQIGEESGKLSLMLSYITKWHEEQVERSLKKMSSLMEPLIMIIVGVLIGGVVIGMYLPIFKLGTII